MKTSPLICRANQWTGFYMIRTSVMKGLKIVPCHLGLSWEVKFNASLSLCLLLSVLNKPLRSLS